MQFVPFYLLTASLVPFPSAFSGLLSLLPTPYIFITDLINTNRFAFFVNIPIALKPFYNICSFYEDFHKENSRFFFFFSTHTRSTFGTLNLHYLRLKKRSPQPLLKIYNRTKGEKNLFKLEVLSENSFSVFIRKT